MTRQSACSGVDDSESGLQAAGHGSRAELNNVVPAGAPIEDGIDTILALASKRTRGDGRVLDCAVNESAGRIRDEGNCVTAAGFSGNEVVACENGRCHSTASIDSEGCMAISRVNDLEAGAPRSPSSSIRRILDVKRWADDGRLRGDGNSGSRAGHDVDGRG